MQVIRALTTPRSPRELRAVLEHSAGEVSSETLDGIAAAWGGRITRRYMSAATLNIPRIPRRQAHQLLEQLAAGGWAERGAEINCPLCGMPSFIEITSITPAASCPGCGASGLLTGQTGIDIFYRLNSLVDRSSDQGVLPHVAAQIALLKADLPCRLLLGADVRWPNGDIAEIDILGFIGDEVVAGEVKTNPDQFTSEQIKRDVLLSKRLGADRHILATPARLKDEVVACAIKLAGEAAIKLTAVALNEQQELAAAPYS